MPRDYQQECYIVICGEERAVTVDFRVTSWGSSDTYWEPGDAPEIEIDAVHDSESGRDLLDFVSTTRDLWAHAQHSEGYFNVGHGPARLNPYRDVPDGAPNPQPRIYPAWSQVTVNAQLIIDALHEDIIVNHLPEPEYDYDDY